MPVDLRASEMMTNDPVARSIITVLAAHDQEHPLDYLAGHTLIERVRLATGQMPYDSFARLHTIHGLVEQQANVRDPSRPGPDAWRLTDRGRECWQQYAPPSAAPKNQPAPPSAAPKNQPAPPSAAPSQISRKKFRGSDGRPR